MASEFLPVPIMNIHRVEKGLPIHTPLHLGQDLPLLVEVEIPLSTIRSFHASEKHPPSCL